MFARAFSAACLAAVMAAPAHAEDAPSFGFDLTLTLSEKLLAELTPRGETIIIAAWYYGDPNAAGAPHVDEMEFIQLGDERIEIPPASGPVRVTGGGIDAAKLGYVEGGVKVNVNIFSGRKSSEDNLISCDFIDGPVAELTAAPTEIACGLITEDLPTMMKPAKG